MGRRKTVSKAPVTSAEKKFERRMKEYEQYQYQELDMSKYDLDLDKYKQENVLEDMPGLEAARESADYASEQFQQSQANIMQAYRGAAGASGVAGVAQAMAGAGTEFARQQQVSLGEQAAEARRLAVQEKARLGAQERQLMLAQDVGRRDLIMQEEATRRDFGYGKMTTLLGVAGENLAGARQLYAARVQAAAQKSSAMWGAIGSIGAAVITKSDRKLKKNIKKERKSPKGLQIYSFEFKDPKDGEGRFEGVIADSLPISVKNKVSHKSSDGYDMVDYSKIDVNFKKV